MHGFDDLRESQFPVTMTNIQGNQLTETKGLFELTVWKVPAADWLIPLPWPLAR